MKLSKAQTQAMKAYAKAHMSDRRIKPISVYNNRQNVSYRTAKALEKRGLITVGHADRMYQLEGIQLTDAGKEWAYNNVVGFTDTKQSQRFVCKPENVIKKIVELTNSSEDFITMSFKKLGQPGYETIGLFSRGYKIEARHSQDSQVAHIRITDAEIGEIFGDPREQY